MAICAAGATGFVVLAVQYHRFSADIKRSEASLPATIRAVLPPSRGTLDQPQVTLVRGSGRPGVGRARPVSHRARPGDGRVPLVPPSATLDDVHVSRQSIRRLIHVLQARLGIQVAHVAVINLGNVSRLVDGIGGIELRNPAEVELPVSPSRTWRFPAGTLRLNGPHAAVYLRQGAPGSEQRDLAERRVLRAIVGHALEPTSVGDLQATGTAVAHSAVTDLTDADVLGLVWDRLQSQHVVQCAAGEYAGGIRYRPGRRRRVPRPRRIGSVPAGCRGTAIASTPYLPPKTVVVIVQHYGAWAFVVVGAAAVLMALAMAALFMRMRVRAPAPDGPPLRPISPRIAGTAGARMRRSEALTARASRAGARSSSGAAWPVPGLAAARSTAGPRLGGSCAPGRGARVPGADAPICLHASGRPVGRPGRRSRGGDACNRVHRRLRGVRQVRDGDPRRAQRGTGRGLRASERAHGVSRGPNVSTSWRSLAWPMRSRVAPPRLRRGARCRG